MEEPSAAPGEAGGGAKAAGTESPGSSAAPWRPGLGRLRARLGPGRRPRPLTVLAVLGVLLFALWGIGGPLAGTSTLTPTDEMVTNGPWSSAGYTGVVPSNTFLDDTYTSELPSEILFKKQLDHGKVAQWNPYGAAGSALGSIPDYAFYSPLTVPFYVMPAWLAPAYERLLEIVCSVGGAYLFLRRVRLSKPSAVLGGIAFAGSGFMVAWLGFPQTRVAAFIPALFWVVERFIQERRVTDAALAALPVASILLGGFPSVAGYSLLTVGAYALVRLAGEHRDDLRRVIRPLLYLGGSLAAGVGLALFQLVPFLGFFGTWLISGRDQTSSATLPVSSLLTAIAPFSLGTVDAKDPVQFVLSTNMVESVTYLGAAAVVLVLIAVAMPRRGRALMPTGVWVFFVAATLAWSELIFVGGPPLGAAQKLPVLRSLFEQNFVGRARSVLGFLLAVLVAVGFEMLLRVREEKAPSRRRQLWGAAVAVGGLGAGLALFKHGHGTVRLLAGNEGQDVGKALEVYRNQIAIAAVVIVIALACAIGLRVAGRPSFAQRKEANYLRLGAATTLIVLVVAQGAQFMKEYYPHSSKDQFYPVTDTHQFLANNLGEQRYVSSFDAMEFGTTTAYDLRAVNGHTFLNANFAALLQGMPDAVVPYPTYVDFQPNDLKQATSPVLDRLGTKYWVAGPTDGVFGTLVASTHSGTVQLPANTPVTVPITGPVRGVSFTPQGDIPSDIAGLTKATVSVVIKDTSGKQIAEASRLTGMQPGAPFEIAVTADNVPPNTPLTATVTVNGTGTLTVDAYNGKAAIDTIVDANDGLRLAYVGSTVVYERLNALPRIRWASQSSVVASQDQRVALLNAGSVAADSVLLTDPGPAASGQPAAVQVMSDGTDSISTAVDAQGSGYLVVADADQVGWRASVDGRPAALVKADQGLVAVNVPAGKHTVTVQYGLPHQTLATWTSVGFAAALAAVPAAEWWWPRRRRLAGGTAGSGGSAGAAAAAAGAGSGSAGPPESVGSGDPPGPSDLLDSPDPPDPADSPDSPGGEE